ncbi:conserved hypothetical protein [Leptospira interrogans serovar Manilae]|uniref:Uncharacterized protein n=1 Tax=Leptospira interrogans serovar Manilae TaxID=214675 RepID=A0AAQ1NW56_LEPIR|nr:hypothetical protein LEP1GSC089_3632 [Leptospira interrogans serovar Autumnalis str. LP101]SOR60565.1 conserved hypothetical protein [Leptospira interrogans serovar Manilae]
MSDRIKTIDLTEMTIAKEIKNLSGEARKINDSKRIQCAKK